MAATWLATQEELRGHHDNLAFVPSRAVRRQLEPLDRDRLCVTAKNTAGCTVATGGKGARWPVIETGSLAWEASMIPLHYQRLPSLFIPPAAGHAAHVRADVAYITCVQGMPLLRASCFLFYRLLHARNPDVESSTSACN
jgi:hypothetical protein